MLVLASAVALGNVSTPALFTISFLLKLSRSFHYLNIIGYCNAISRAGRHGMGYIRSVKYRLGNNEEEQPGGGIIELENNE